VRVDNIRHTQFARSPRIARAVADPGFGRELGEGVNRMYEEMGRAGLPEPVFVQTPASVRVTFLADPISARILAALPRGSERFVEHLNRTGRVTTTEAIELLGVSRPTAIGISSTSSTPACWKPCASFRTTLVATGGRSSRVRDSSNNFGVTTKL